MEITRNSVNFIKIIKILSLNFDLYFFKNILFSFAAFQGAREDSEIVKYLLIFYNFFSRTLIFLPFFQLSSKKILRILKIKDFFFHRI